LHYQPHNYKSWKDFQTLHLYLLFYCEVSFYWRFFWKLYSPKKEVFRLKICSNINNHLHIVETASPMTVNGCAYTDYYQ